MYAKSLEPLELAGHYFIAFLYVSFIQLLFPLNLLMDRFFIHQTKRKAPELGINFFNEATLFFIIIWLIKDSSRFYGVYDENIVFARPDMTENQLFACNILQHQIYHTYPFEYALAMLAGNTWMKLLLKLRLTKKFGPMIKTLQNMTLDLLQFAIIWGIVLVMFTCVAALVFGQLNGFQDFFLIFIYFFESSLGTWSVRAYHGVDFTGADLDDLQSIGEIFHSVFLLINMVLFLNFVIAIMSSTFAYYETKQLGLYYEVLISNFPAMEYDDRYGALACAQPPFNLMILPF